MPKEKKTASHDNNVKNATANKPVDNVGAKRAYVHPAGHPEPRTAKSTPSAEQSALVTVMATCFYAASIVGFVLALFWSLRAVFMPSVDYSSILYAVAGAIIGLVTLVAGIAFSRRQQTARRLAQFATVVVLICSIVASVPALVGGFPSQRGLDVWRGGCWTNEVESSRFVRWEEVNCANSADDALSTRQALYVTIWVIRFAIRTGLAVVLIVWLGKSKQLKAALVK